MAQNLWQYGKAAEMETNKPYDNVRNASNSAGLFFLIVVFLFIAAVNFVGVMGRAGSGHTAGGLGGDKAEANEHSTPNDPATRYKYTPGKAATDSGRHMGN